MSELLQRSLIVHRDWSGLLYVVLGILAGAAVAVLLAVTGNPMFVLVAILGLIGLGAIIYQMEIGLMVMVFITYTRFSDVLIEFHGAPSVAKFFIAGMLGLIVLRWFVLNERPENWFVPLSLIGLLGLAGYIGLLHARNPDATLTRLEDYIKDVMITLAIVFLVKRGETLRRVLIALIIAGTFLGSLSVYQYLTGTFDNNYYGFAQAEVQNIFGDTDDFRISGPLGGANPFAQVILALIPICLDRLLHDRSIFVRFVALWGFAATVLTVIFTFSRGSFLGMTAAGVIFAIIYIRRPSRLLALAVAIALIYPLLPAQYTDRISTLVELVPGLSSGPVDETSFRGRTSENLVAWRMFKDHAIVGVGWNNYNSYYYDYSSKLGIDQRREARSAHNLYLELGAELGIVGLGAFLIAIGIMFRRMIRARHQLFMAGFSDYGHMVTGLALGLFGFLVTATFVHDSYPRFFWLLFGVAMSTSQVAYNEIKARQAAQSAKETGTLALP